MLCQAVRMKRQSCCTGSRVPNKEGTMDVKRGLHVTDNRKASKAEKRVAVRPAPAEIISLRLK